MHVKVHEDNVDELTLTGLEPWHMTPCSKHYTIKYHLFWEHVEKCRIWLLKIDTKEQLGDIFTKGLVESSLVHLSKHLMGWWCLLTVQSDLPWWYH
jgi:hypothetical protein